ncbi:MAG: (Fe-S)-binding protein [Chloroflexota bacterium]
MEDKPVHRQGVKSAVRSIEGAMRSIGARMETDFEGQKDNIRKNGIVFASPVLRNSIIGGLEIRTKRGSAENLVVIGCACFGTALPLRSYCLLLQRLGVDYVFLEKEYCCGAPLLHSAVLQGQDAHAVDDAIQEFMGLNVSQARERGVKNILYFCIWCAYLGKRFFSNCGINQMYAFDILPERLAKADLRLDMAIGYFGGLSHRRPVYVPDQDFDLNWSSYLGLLEQVKGLRVVKIPKYCCQVAPQAIFDRAKKEGVNTLVVDCIVCYGNLVRKAARMAPGMRVKYLTDVLLAALEHDERVLDYL